MGHDKDSKEFEKAVHEISDELSDFLDDFLENKEEDWKEFNFPNLISIALVEFCEKILMSSASVEDQEFPLSEKGFSEYISQVSKFCAMLLVSLEIEGRRLGFSEIKRDALLKMASICIDTVLKDAIAKVPEGNNINVH